MFYKTSRCPHCKKTLQLMASQYGGYESPFRICPYCGGEYYDADFIELAAQTPGYLIKEAIIFSLRWGIIGGCVLFVIIALVVTQSMSITNMFLLIYLLIVLLGIVGIFYVYYSSIKREALTSPAMIESWLRLMDASYRSKYERMAGRIPDNSFFRILEKQSSARPRT